VDRAPGATALSAMVNCYSAGGRFSGTLGGAGVVGVMRTAMAVWEDVAEDAT